MVTFQTFPENPLGSRPRKNEVRFHPEIHMANSPEILDFSMPSPEIKTDKLREPLRPDLDMAREMFVGHTTPVVPRIIAENTQKHSGSESVSMAREFTRPKIILNVELARALFVVKLKG